MARRDSITVVVDAIPFPTQISEVVVFVDHDGRPVRTATEVVVLVPSTIAQATSQSATSAGVTSPAAQQPTVHANPDSTQVPGPATGGPSSGHPSPDLNGVEGGDSTASAARLPGVSYSPFDADGSCKSKGRVFSDLQRIATLYGLVRIYGADCAQVATVLSAARSIGLKVFLGIFNLDGLEGQIAELVNAVHAHGDWSVVETVSVGNELVNNGQATAQEVVNAVAAVRQSLRSAGFHGPVVTVDTFVAVLRNPWLCDYSDFCAINIHPFFDPNTPATAAGSFVYNQVAAVRNVLQNPNQRIVVTETGWPWQGCANGDAVPGKENQRVAISSIKTAFGAGHPGNLILFSAFNDLWKRSEPSTFYAEQYWGINQF
ncbi:Glycoside hydrolase [Coniochaeta hoffmannii]|uniref:Glycoside hydrolase n=1 Tax=Coniochaeta hoffmannii TaxID=91930 RepID=A0AA38VS73_9PEZI|nr:Glycoside hydrolase [Coniochaeta hoffmannii]